MSTTAEYVTKTDLEELTRKIMERFDHMDKGMSILGQAMLRTLSRKPMFDSDYKEWSDRIADHFQNPPGSN